MDSAEAITGCEPNRARWERADELRTRDEPKDPRRGADDRRSAVTTERATWEPHDRATILATNDDDDRHWKAGASLK